MRYLKSILVLLSTLIGISNLSAQKNAGGNYTFETECFGVELDGSQTLKAWGNGRNSSDAVEQAKKNAVRDVIFKGIQNGKSECNRSALLLEANAQTKYEDYFFKFFADGGEYSKYVNQKDEKIVDKISRDKKKARESVTKGVLVRVLRNELKQKLKADGILK